MVGPCREEAENGTVVEQQGGKSSLFRLLTDVICSSMDRKVTENYTEREDLD